MFGEGDSLLKVGVVMMALAIAVVTAAVVVSVALRIEPGQVGAAEVVRKSRGEPPKHSSGEKESVMKRSSVEEETLGYGSSHGTREQRGEEAKERLASEASANARPEARSRLQPEPKSGQRTLPAGESDWPRPTQQEIEAANNPRHYDLPAGAIMSLTINSIGIYGAPVFDSDGRWALVNGVAHVPETSLPWSNTPQRNVYLAGHRMGYRGTWSRMIFYNLGRLGEGDRIVLRDRSGRTYEYRVSETFLADPTDSWVMGQVRGKDLLTLQTCTPIPTFEKRLIVRADRV